MPLSDLDALEPGHVTDHSEVLQCGDHPIHPTGVTVGVQEMSGKLSAGPSFAML